MTGQTRWTIPEGYIPPDDLTKPPELVSHEAFCILNATDQTAEISIFVYFSDREPAGPYRLEVPARRTRHLHFDALQHPEPIPRGTNYASVITSSVPVVVQHTRLDSRSGPIALMTTIAYPG